MLVCDWLAAKLLSVYYVMPSRYLSKTADIVFSSNERKTLTEKRDTVVMLQKGNYIINCILNIKKNCKN